MIGIIIASTLIGIMPAVTIWMLWKRLEYKAWIGPAKIDALMMLAKAIWLANSQLMQASILCDITRMQSAQSKANLKSGGISHGPTTKQI